MSFTQSVEEVIPIEYNPSCMIVCNFLQNNLSKWKTRSDFDFDVNLNMNLNQ